MRLSLHLPAWATGMLIALSILSIPWAAWELYKLYFNKCYRPMR
jgi:hypothetical protein